MATIDEKNDFDFLSELIQLLNRQEITKPYGKRLKKVAERYREFHRREKRLGNHGDCAILERNREFTIHFNSESSEVDFLNCYLIAFGNYQLLVRGEDDVVRLVSKGSIRYIAFPEYEEPPDGYRVVPEGEVLS